MAGFEVKGKTAADEARAAGDQNAFWNGRVHSGGTAGGVDFLQNCLQTVAEFPVGIMRLKFPHVADPPDVVADAVVFDVSPFQFATADVFAQINGFKHRTVRVAAAADVIDFARARFLEKLPESLDQIVAVNVVTHLLAFVAKHAIGRAVHRTTHEIGKKTVQFGAGVRRAGQTSATKT